jgi:hypothetical protein
LGLTGQKTISGAENLGQIDPGYNDVADAMSLPAPTQARIGCSGSTGMQPRGGLAVEIAKRWRRLRIRRALMI